MTSKSIQYVLYCVLHASFSCSMLSNILLKLTAVNENIIYDFCTCLYLEKT
jgi:hypothetical protein